MAISKVIPQKSQLLSKSNDAKRRILSHQLDELSQVVLSKQQQSEKSWQQYCRQCREQQQLQQLKKNQEQQQQQQQQQHHKAFSTNNPITSLRLSFSTGSRKLLTERKKSFRRGGELSKLKGCNTVIKSMKVVDNIHDRTLNFRRLNHLSKLALLTLSLSVILFSFASHANIALSMPNTEPQMPEFNLNRHREIFDRIARDSFTRNLNQLQHQQQQQFLQNHQGGNLLNQPASSQPPPAAAQQQQLSNDLQTLQQQPQLGPETSSNSRFVRLLSNHQQVSAASNAEPVWTSSEPVLNEQTSFVSDSSAGGNNKNFNLDSVSGAPSFSGLAIEQPRQQQPGQYFAYRPLTGLKPTTPSINRQIIPPPFYELDLTPINTVQVEHHVVGNSIQEPDSDGNKERVASLASSHNARQNGARSLNGLNHQLPHQQQQLIQQPFEPNLLAVNPTARSNMFQQQALDKNLGDSINSSSKKEAEQAQNSDNNQPKHANEDNSTGNIGATNNNGDSGKSGADNSRNSSSNELQVVDKAIEPRQKRRIFNRILKKAEWNHLFVELSKVFLRYFLDLALKDIIGKQSSGDTTTSRKKLDAQSELTDLLKDFVKTAISNI